VIVAAIIVFVLAISSFVPPDLIGGGRVMVLATEIYSDATNTLNWPLAAALAVLLMGMFGALYALYSVAMHRSYR
jgi:putative spermidine/putrescine transport system permease protein